MRGGDETEVKSGNVSLVEPLTNENGAPSQKVLESVAKIGNCTLCKCTFLSEI